MQTQLMNWGEQHTIYRLLHVGSLYADSLRLVRRWALSRYDERWQREQGFAALPIMKVPAERDACVIAIRDLVPALNAYWSYHFAETELTIDHLQSAIDRMSGVSEAELTTIIRLLRRQPTLISTPVVTQLRRRFSELPESNQHIRELNELIQPSRPHMPDPNWLPDRWLQWATNEYMPYFSWTIRAEQPRDYQQQCALSFGEWLAEQYPRFLNNDASPLLIRQFTLMRDLLRNDPQAIVVWLIVDGMTWWQSIRLLEECRQQNLFAQRVEPSIAMLPSITSISKRALVTGLPSVEPRQQSIAVAAREQLARAGISSYVGYSLSQALEVLRQPAPPRCAIVLYNALDQLAHNMTTFSDNEGIRGCLRGLAQDLAKMKQVCNEHGNIFHALIGSDHGSTLLPSDAPLRRLPQATREITDIWEDDLDQEGASSASHRAAVIIDSQRLVIDHPEHWYILDKDRYQLNQSYLVPRGYGYVTRKPTGWTHGGLTPEEVVVPLIHLASEPLQVLQAIVRITGSLRSRQATNLTLEVVNPNAAPLNEIAFQIADLEPLHIDQIAAGSTLTQQIHFPARPIDGAELVIQWSLICAILGTPYEQRGREVLSVRRLQTEDTLDDFFS
jgi:hypothetical protein